jgi:hypothetical protein
MGHQARQPEHWEEPGDRPGAWFISAKHLAPLDQLWPSDGTRLGSTLDLPFLDPVFAYVSIHGRF